MKNATKLVLPLLLALVASASGQTVIRYLQPGVDQPNLRAPVEEMIAQFEAEHPDIDVRLESVGWGDAYQKITTDLLAGNAADVMYVGARWIPAFAALGGIQDLGEFVDDEKLTLFPSGLMEGQRFRGNLYALPVAFSTKVLYYRTDLIDGPPETWEELLSAAQRVTQETDTFGIGLPGAAHVGTVQQFQVFLHQAGGSFFDSEGRVNLETPEAREALSFYTDLYLEHEVAPNPIEFNREELPTLFGEGRIAMHINGPWARTIMGKEPDNDEVPYATAVLPCNERCGGILGADSLVIAENTRNAEAAYTFVDYLTSFEPHTKRILASGLTPMLEGQAELEEFQTPFWRPFVDMIEIGFPEAQPLAWEPFEQIIGDMIQSVFLGQRGVDEALAQAADQIRDQQLEPARAD
jgi:multiple sugar transport system substrate-binding protein